MAGVERDHLDADMDKLMDRQAKVYSDSLIEAVDDDEEVAADLLPAPARLAGASVAETVH